MAQVELLVEVDVALSRPPRVDARTWTWVLAENGPLPASAACEAEETAMLMAMCDPRVVMAVGARVIDWKDTHA